MLKSKACSSCQAVVLVHVFLLLPSLSDYMISLSLSLSLVCVLRVWQGEAGTQDQDRVWSSKYS